MTKTTIQNPDHRNPGVDRYDFDGGRSVTIIDGQSPQWAGDWDELDAQDALAEIRQAEEAAQMRYQIGTIEHGDFQGDTLGNEVEGRIAWRQ